MGNAPKKQKKKGAPQTPEASNIAQSYSETRINVITTHGHQTPNDDVHRQREELERREKEEAKRRFIEEREEMKRQLDEEKRKSQVAQNLLGLLSEVATSSGFDIHSTEEERRGLNRDRMISEIKFDLRTLSVNDALASMDLFIAHREDEYIISNFDPHIRYCYVVTGNGEKIQPAVAQRIQRHPYAQKYKFDWISPGELKVDLIGRKNEAYSGNKGKRRGF